MFGNKSQVVFDLNQIAVTHFETIDAFKLTFDLYYHTDTSCRLNLASIRKSFDILYEIKKKSRKINLYLFVYLQISVVTDDDNSLSSLSLVEDREKADIDDGENCGATDNTSKNEFKINLL